MVLSLLPQHWVVSQDRLCSLRPLISRLLEVSAITECGDDAVDLDLADAIDQSSVLIPFVLTVEWK